MILFIVLNQICLFRDDFFLSESSQAKMKKFGFYFVDVSINKFRFRDYFENILYRIY